MRSSIACIRCRRSKVKCVNNGVGTTCRSCENSGRDCSYPSPVTTGTRRRDSISGQTSGYGEAPKRQKKAAHTFVANLAAAQRESPRPQLDALDARLLTPQVWQELFDIWQVHYSADLPFLHPPTFLKPLRSAQQHSSSAPNFNMDPPSAVRPPASSEFLLAFLALTARFHPRIVAHHSPPTSTRVSNPLIASEYYAMAANERMANFWTDNRAQDIERTQAALMLGLHEWGMCRGSKAWLIIGMAIRSAQAMGLQYEYDLDDAPLSRSLALNAEAERMGVESKNSSNSARPSEDVFIQQEVRRRTFWSCFIMDRYLSSGKYRPQMLYARELRIQLPASERSFLFAEKVRTLMLGEDDRRLSGLGRADVQNHRQQTVMLGTGGTPEPYRTSTPNGHAAVDGEDDKGRLETGADEGLESQYIKVLELYGKVIKWSCAGGRRIEEYPPWDPRCEFARLRQLCHDFKARLPRQHALSPQNTQAHISMKFSTPYTLVHAVYLLCQIILHREYIPFIPIRCSKPQGPVDPPMFPPDRYEVPPGFWHESARECFKAARDIIDLVRTCQEWNALVETPLVGFAIYTVAFTGVYCINFPWMDPEGYMCTPPTPESRLAGTRPGESKGFEAARKSLEMIGSMRLRLHMADGWFSTINRMHRYFRRMKSDYRKNTAAIDSSSDGDSPLSTRHLTLREGGSGGGLDEFKLLERTLQDFGNLEDEDVQMTDVRQQTRPLDAVYDDSSAGGTVKSEEPEHRAVPGAEPPKSEGSWSAINAGPPGVTSAPASTPSRHPSISNPSSGLFRSYEPYPTHAPPTSHPSPPHSGSQPNYAHQINNFRPSYPDTSAPAAPSLTSPASHSATSNSQASPTYSNNAHAYASTWTSQPSGYHQLPPPHSQYANGAAHVQPYSSTPSANYSNSAYPTPSHLAPPHQQQQLQAAPTLPEIQKPWNPVEKEAWLNSLDTRLGGDDIAAFVDGGEWADWANLAASQGFAHGWLANVWNGGQ